MNNNHVERGGISLKVRSTKNEKVTFEDTYTPGNIAAENTHYRHAHYPEMLTKYDSNFIEFKTLPSLKTFKVVGNYVTYERESPPL